MGMEQREASERLGNGAEAGERDSSARLSQEGNSDSLKGDGYASKAREDSTKELDFNSGKAIERVDASPKQIAENIAKDGTFGKGDARFDTEMTLSKAMRDGKSGEVVAEINKELAAAGSKYSVQEQVGGGGSGSADRVVKGVRTSTRESSTHGEFTVKGENGQNDRMALSHGSKERIENGKVVGGSTWSKGETGDSAGSWGKAPRESSKRDSYPLNNLTIDGYNVQGPSTAAFGKNGYGSTMMNQIEQRKR